jgi:hypothetical protein
MSIQQLQSNHELLNTYNRLKQAIEEYRALPGRMEKEGDIIRAKTLEAIEELVSFDSFEATASSDEVREIEALKAEIGATNQ